MKESKFLHLISFNLIAKIKQHQIYEIQYQYFSIDKEIFKI
jgi:hypothetical protein